MFEGIKAYYSTTVSFADQDVKQFPLDTVEFASTGYSLTSSRVVVPSTGIYRARANAFIHGQVYSDAPMYILKNPPVGTSGSGSFPTGGAAAIIRGAQFTPYTAQPFAVGGVGMVCAEVECTAGDVLNPWLYVDDAAQGHGPFTIGHATQQNLQITFFVEFLGAKA